MVLLMDAYRNLTSLSIKTQECAFKQFKSLVLKVLSVVCGAEALMHLCTLSHNTIQNVEEKENKT